MIGNVLVIEDDKDIGEVISICLINEGMHVDHVLSGEEGLDRVQTGDYDLLILDLTLPGLDGYEFLQIVRKEQTMPIVIISGRDEDIDEVLGFGYGADDFVKKPFSAKVFASRIRAHIRRERRKAEVDLSKIISFKDYELNIVDRILKKNEESISLSPKEMSLLCELASRKGSPVSQLDLYENIWGNEFGDMSTISVHIQRLRKKIETDPANPEIIKTVFGFGYMFRDDILQESLEPSL